MVSGVRKKCSEPEAVGNLHHGGAQSLRRRAILVNGVRKECAKPEADGNCVHGGAQSLRRPAILVSGMHKKRSEPAAVGNFTIWGYTEPETSHNFGEWSAQKVLRA